MTIIEDLEFIRHNLICTSHYRATDLTVKQFDRLLESGVDRNKLEFMINHEGVIARIDKLIDFLSKCKLVTSDN